MGVQLLQKGFNVGIIHTVLLAEFAGGISGDNLMGIDGVGNVFMLCGGEEIALSALNSIQSFDFIDGLEDLFNLYGIGSPEIIADALNGLTGDHRMTDEIILKPVFLHGAFRSRSGRNDGEIQREINALPGNDVGRILLALPVIQLDNGVKRGIVIQVERCADFKQGVPFLDLVFDCADRDVLVVKCDNLFGILVRLRQINRLADCNSLERNLFCETVQNQNSSQVRFIIQPSAYAQRYK